MKDNNMPKISVIVPVYNTEKYLRRCVDSILAQTFSDFELLLVDDGSTDSSPAICDEYANLDSRVRVFHKENGGVSSARNLALDNAEGEWITFADSDDWTYPTWLYNFMIKDLERYDLVCQGIYLDNKANTENGYQQSLKTMLSYRGNKIFIPKILTDSGNLGYTVNKIFRNDIISQNRLKFDTRFYFQEDEIFILHYLSFTRRNILCIPKIGYHYYVPNWSRKYQISNKYVYLIELEKFKALKNIFKQQKYNKIKHLLSFLRQQHIKHLKLRMYHLGFVSTFYIRLKMILNL